MSHSLFPPRDRLPLYFLYTPPTPNSPFDVPLAYMGDPISHDVTLPKAMMVGIWLESIFWGFYSGLFILCIWVFKYRRRHLSTGVLTGVVAMYVLATVHCFNEMQFMVNAFVDHGGSVSVLTAFNTNNNVLCMVIYAVNNSLSDAVVVWRCIAVWQKDWRACFLPVTLLIATTVNGLYFASLYHKLVPGDEDYTASVHTNGIAFFALSLATNSITTSLVAGRIWWLAHKVYVPGLSTGRYNAVRRTFSPYVVAMLVESGILYSMIKVAELVLYSMGSPSFYIVFYSMAQIMCITPTAIFIFVALGIVQTGNPHPTMDPGGRSIAGGGGAISGASFRFARPAFMQTFNRTNTMNSGVGVSFPVATYTGRVDFKLSEDSTVVSSHQHRENGLNDVSEGSSYDSRKESSNSRSSIEIDLERQDAGSILGSVRP